MFVTILIKREKGCVFIQIDVIMFLTTSYDTTIPGKGAAAPVSNENKTPGGVTAVGISLSLYRGNEFAILRVFESQKSPFTTKGKHICYISRKHENFR